MIVDFQQLYIDQYNKALIEKRMRERAFNRVFVHPSPSFPPTPLSPLYPLIPSPAGMIGERIIWTVDCATYKASIYYVLARSQQNTRLCQVVTQVLYCRELLQYRILIADGYGNIIKPKDGPNIADLCVMYCLSKGGDYDRLPHHRAPDPVLAGHIALMRRSHDDHVTPPLIHEPHHRLTTRPRHAITN